MNIKASLAVAALSVVCAIAPAHAATFTYEDSAPTRRDGLGLTNRAGKYSNILATFNDETDVLNWSSTFTRKNNQLSDGAWLVLSDGENPKNNVDEYAIMYLDAANEKVSIYNYDGRNKASSYETEDFLGSTALNVIRNGNDEVTFEFSLDATDINNNTNYGPDWKGIAFGEEIGIWFHNTAGLHTSYGANGELLEFNSRRSGWYDTTKGLPTIVSAASVPEPGSVAALAVFGVAAATKLRKRVG